MSLYVEVGFPRDAEVDVAATRARVLDDLRARGWSPTTSWWPSTRWSWTRPTSTSRRRSLAERERLAALLRARDVYSIGRYGGWTYCSIEDNIVEARALMARSALTARSALVRAPRPPAGPRS